MNSNSLPIALMQSLVVTVPGLKWGHDDNKNAMVGRALTYLVLYSTLGMIVSYCSFIPWFDILMADITGPLELWCSSPFPGRP